MATHVDNVDTEDAQVNDQDKKTNLEISDDDDDDHDAKEDPTRCGDGWPSQAGPIAGT